ncbi:glutamate synthase (NADPH), homotetrameric [Spirochaeta thermophila DSM 6578]|uniref:Glutamate synthase (NADPH), homotetrameric n=1 Tax=Winmispira thermophila (strain ATCC 700085 / DSM 6578 / Z-1203) TaxID=869211 RepID=G0GFE6_WINT7|nr:NADPH-dependent glutamate synthase [Spirochaeta thermophila]AEJ61560.1 glutamate synthase (NADPH), homotetrameric [Spirochaeta thermophila DSM 6578]
MEHRHISDDVLYSKEELDRRARELLSDLEGRTLRNKERLAIPPQPMPELDPVIRSRRVDEVTLGYTETQAKVEALRCLQCKNAPCIAGCPVSINIPAFIQKIVEGEYKESVDIIKETNLLPSICGRVCPQEKQCQEACTVGKALKDPLKAVSIGRLERFVADWEREHGLYTLPPVKPDSGKKVAIIGSGPAGLTAAVDLRREGHTVVIFEAFPKAGGVMVYGIPEFRLPKRLVEDEIRHLEDLGVEFVYDFLVGKARTLTQLLEEDGFDAVFISAGAGLPKFMGIEGEDLVGVYSANEYLTRTNLMKAYDRERADTPILLSRRVAVIGGGNVAMDAARMALRVGAEEVIVIYRRTEKEMPARREEVIHAMEEGVEFRFLTNVKRIMGDGEGKVRAVECLSYRLGEPDASGRPRPVPIEGSEHSIEVDTVIFALGSVPHPLIRKTMPEVAVSERGTIVVDEHLRTSHPRIFAGGDVVTGAATVIEAMGAGRKAARSIHLLLTGELPPPKEAGTS